MLWVSIYLRVRASSSSRVGRSRPPEKVAKTRTALPLATLYKLAAAALLLFHTYTSAGQPRRRWRRRDEIGARRRVRGPRVLAKPRDPLYDRR